MSTVVAVRKNGIACLAADSLTTFGDQKQSPVYDRFSEKIQETGEGGIAIVGSAAHTLVIESVIREKRVKLDLRDRMRIFESFRALHGELKEHYFLNPKDGDDNEDPYESTRIDALIANPHGIFGLFALREVYEYRRFWAVGSGAEYALGAMYSVYETTVDAETVARAGVAAGAEFDTGSGQPVSVRSWPLADEAQEV